MPASSPKTESVLVPADGGIFRVFGDEDLLQFGGSKRREAFCLDARIGKEVRHILGFYAVPPPLKSYRQPNDTTHRLPLNP